MDVAEEVVIWEYVSICFYVYMMRVSGGVYSPQNAGRLNYGWYKGGGEGDRGKFVLFVAHKMISNVVRSEMCTEYCKYGDESPRKGEESY